MGKNVTGVDRRETELVNLRLRGTVSDTALDRNAALLHAERTHLTDELDRQQEAIATVEQGQAAVASLEAVREQICDRLDSATLEERRDVLETLDTRVTVHLGGALEVNIGIPRHVSDCVHQPQGQ